MFVRVVDEAVRQKDIVRRTPNTRHWLAIDEEPFPGEDWGTLYLELPSFSGWIDLGRGWRGQEYYPLRSGEGLASPVDIASKEG